MLIPSTADMALPVIKTIQDCADYSKTFEPYLPQLYTLPNSIASSITSPDALKHIYASTNPAISGLAFSIAIFPIFLIVSEINKNYSQVDRVWSILPTIYNAHYAIWARVNGLPTQRVDNVLAFSVLWTVRLTFNYWRRGGYKVGSEDYRWALVKERIGSAGFFVLNILFISSLQSVLLWAVTTPTYIILQASRLQPTMTAFDTLLARGLMGLVVFEWFADGQQWNYHKAKDEYRETAKVPVGYTRAQMDRGFNTTGLFKYSRHPNFAAEQAIWVVLYQWGCLASESFLNWTVAGTIAYLAVFAGSTPLTEAISAGKYPEYKLYQERVGRFVPKFFGKRWDEKEMETLGPQLAKKMDSEKKAAGKK